MCAVLCLKVARVARLRNDVDYFHAVFLDSARHFEASPADGPVVKCLVKLNVAVLGRAGVKRDGSATALRQSQTHLKRFPPQTSPPPPLSQKYPNVPQENQSIFADACLVFTDGCQAEGLRCFATTPSEVQFLDTQFHARL